MFRFDKLTIKAQEAISDGQAMAVQQGNPEFTTLHLLSRLIDQTDGIVLPLIEKSGASLDQLRSLLFYNRHLSTSRSTQ